MTQLYKVLLRRRPSVSPLTLLPQQKVVPRHSAPSKQASIVSLSQLKEGAFPQESGPMTPVDSRVWGPEALVTHSPGQPLPLYQYTRDLKECLGIRAQRATSVDSSSIFCVPDQDMVSPSSPDSPTSSDLSSEMPPLFTLMQASDEQQDSEVAVVPEMSLTCEREREGSLMDTVLTALWDDCMAKGLFRYWLVCSS